MAVTVYNRIHNASGSGHPQLVRSLMRILEDADLSGELILTNRKLKEYPKSAAKFNLADTVIADLSRNRFCELPEQITTFAFLETLILYHNTIRTITPSVKSLTSLTYLDLRSNQLSTLPRELCFLPLQVLLVSNNRLVSLPDELGRLDKLTDLDASYNQLTTLPARIGDLRHLRSFSLRNNQLMYLPRELTYLTLVSLDVSNNRISSLPVEMRQMITLVDINLENNPLISPPASLCVRGLVHVFKFLETQATKDERGKSGSNYDGSTTLRRAPRHTAANSILEHTKPPSRNQLEFGYNTCDGIDKRWSHDMPSGKTKSEKSLVSQKPNSVDTFRLELSSALQQTCDEKNAKDIYEPNKQQLQKEENIIYAHSSSNSSSTPEDDVLIENQKGDEKNKNLENVQTYREYKESLKQQRNQDIYKSKGQKNNNHDNSDSNVNNSNNQNEDFENRLNGSSNGVCAAINTKIKNGLVSDDIMVLSKKPIQKVTPSRNTDVVHLKEGEGKLQTNGDCTGGYVKPNSPMKSTNGILSNNNAVGSNKYSPSTKQVSNLKSPGNKSHRTVTWNHDIPPEKLSFTMRREFDKHREEIELLKQLRSIIETRLKMTLPEDIASALTDGVILCHLANYVRPRSVASIHVPSPGVSKLTMARCRRNVDNFLEACRKIGVDEELICSSLDVIPNEDKSEDISIANPSAVYATVIALINIGSEQQQQRRQQAKDQQTETLLTPATNPQTTDMWDNNHCSKDEIDCGDSIEYKFSVNNNQNYEIGNGEGNFLKMSLKTNLNQSERRNDDDGLHYVNEKLKNISAVDEEKTNNNNITSTTILKVNDLNSPISNKFKLLEIPNNVDINNENHNPEKIVTKRIEFFEEQKHSIPTISMSSTLNVSLAKKTNNNDNEKQSTVLRHDSTALTIMLSLIFIVSVVLIIFFPLPS